MPLKDLYRILEISPKATDDEIKKAFRKLAHQYHPDKNPDETFSIARFRDIHESYTILIDRHQRKLYDEERFFAGLTAQKEPNLLTSHWLLQQAKKLRTHMQLVDSDRMNHIALSNYVQLLLSDSHIAVLLHEKDSLKTIEFAEALIVSINHLKYKLLPPIGNRLISLADQHPELKMTLTSFLGRRKREHQVSKLLPIITVMIALAICLLISLLAK